MDEIVERAMLKWPDVPACYGWLTLTRRGEWRFGPERARISHPRVLDFINRNYACDREGRWFFQNGPQRVFVALDATPFVFRLDGARAQLEAHTGQPATHIDACLLDEAGHLYVDTELGIGIIDDRDLDWFADHALSWDVEKGVPESLRFSNVELPVTPVKAADIPAIGGFVRDPGRTAVTTGSSH
ncbi:MAG: hypothetical protein AMXMBFR6_19950 [Betaproteobacteria bacterium]|jgi:hypothetical protein|nr:hypothetical protein [Rhodocyclaceae bacterium]